MKPSEHTVDFLKEKIRKIFITSGFEACGFTDTSALDQSQQDIFKEWLKNQYHATMNYMERNIEKRFNPSLLVENAKSIIVVALNYYTNVKKIGNFRISKYAYLTDYHKIIKQHIIKIIKNIPELATDNTLRIFTDSAPIAERHLAVKAGIGFIGKNNTLIIPQKGSFLFLAEIFTEISLQPDLPFLKSLCGRCRNCIDSCPTQAFVQPYMLDARKCLSYYTIEAKIPTEKPEIKKKCHHWIFGCDICMDVCPWNRFATTNKNMEFQPNEKLITVTDEMWKTMDHATFNKLFKNSPLQRAGHEKIMSNINYWEQFFNTISNINMP